VLETVRIVSDVERLASVMARANTESARARLIRHHYSRGHDEARAQMREAFTLPGDLEVASATRHVLLDSTTPDIVRSFSQSTAIRRAHPKALQIRPGFDVTYIQQRHLNSDPEF
jgi:hypothetical protein